LKNGSFRIGDVRVFRCGFKISAEAALSVYLPVSIKLETMAKKSQNPAPEMLKKAFAMLSRRGGQARAKALSGKQKKGIASKAGQARWAKAREKKDRGSKGEVRWRMTNAKMIPAAESVAFNRNRRDAMIRLVEEHVNATRRWLNDAHGDDIEAEGADRAAVLDDLAGICRDLKDDAWAGELGELADDIREMAK